MEGQKKTACVGGREPAFHLLSTQGSGNGTVDARPMAQVTLLRCILQDHYLSLCQGYSGLIPFTIVLNFRLCYMID